MGLNPRKFYNKTVFLDANAIIYYLEGISNEVAGQIIELGSKEMARIKLLTTTRVIDEILFKITLIRAKALYGFKAKVLEKLKKDKAKVETLAKDIKKVFEFLDTLNITVAETTLKDLRIIPEMMRRWGIFGNDALIIKTMNRYNFKYILSSDKDFDQIKWIERIDPLN